MCTPASRVASGSSSHWQQVAARLKRRERSHLQLEDAPQPHRLLCADRRGGGGEQGAIHQGEQLRGGGQGDQDARQTGCKGAHAGGAGGTACGLHPPAPPPSHAAGAWCIKSRSRRDQPTLTEAAAEAEPRIPYLAAIFALGFLCPLLWFYGWARHSLVKSERWVGGWAGGRGGWPPA